MSTCPTCGRHLPTLPERIGDWLRLARTDAGLNQGQVASRLVPARTRQAVSDIERGRTALTIDLLVQWAEVCRIDPLELIRRAIAQEQTSHVSQSERAQAQAAPRLLPGVLAPD